MGFLGLRLLREKRPVCYSRFQRFNELVCIECKYAEQCMAATLKKEKSQG